MIVLYDFCYFKLEIKLKYCKIFSTVITCWPDRKSLFLIIFLERVSPPPQLNSSEIRLLLKRILNKIFFIKKLNWRRLSNFLFKVPLEVAALGLSHMLHLLYLSISFFKNFTTKTTFNALVSSKLFSLRISIDLFCIIFKALVILFHTILSHWIQTIEYQFINENLKYVETCIMEQEIC